MSIVFLIWKRGRLCCRYLWLWNAIVFVCTYLLVSLSMLPKSLAVGLVLHLWFDLWLARPYTMSSLKRRPHLYLAGSTDISYPAWRGTLVSGSLVWRLRCSISSSLTCSTSSDLTSSSAVTSHNLFNCPSCNFLLHDVLHHCESLTQVQIWVAMISRA